MTNPRKLGKKAIAATRAKASTAIIKHNKHDRRRNRATCFKNFSVNMTDAVKVLKKEGWIEGGVLEAFLCAEAATQSNKKDAKVTMEPTMDQNAEVLADDSQSVASDCAVASDSDNDAELSMLLEQSMTKLWIK
ncbi:expressed unknown protein [Seminavis robusta]|uniref:Uncharacterized protein n=1 Tax=Seminavis robusta TaxID=568900 RepID=A0A9N8EJL7_9STRA|nr:expressed unknown protein [Seminavis robusta]|eukprot:Sro1355_g265470.1 n/a (134) ;mRNA; f:1616-2017